MYFFSTPFLIKKIFRKNIIWEINSSQKTIYLTFDDGPDTLTTPKVLEILDKYNAKATFFCIGKKFEDNPDIDKMLIKSGHSIGNHSYSHPKGWNTETKRYIEDVEKCSKIVKSTLFRPPYGKIKLSQIRNLKRNYSIIMWSLLCGDFDKKISNEKCLDVLLKKTQNGSIVVLHDSSKTEEKLFYVLPKFLEHFTKLGYSFQSITI